MSAGNLEPRRRQFDPPLKMAVRDLQAVNPRFRHFRRQRPLAADHQHARRSSSPGSGRPRRRAGRSGSSGCRRFRRCRMALPNSASRARGERIDGADAPRVPSPRRLAPTSTLPAVVPASSAPNGAAPPEYAGDACQGDIVTPRRAGRAYQWIYCSLRRSCAAGLGGRRETGYVPWPTIVRGEEWPRSAKKPRASSMASRRKRC